MAKLKDFFGFVFYVYLISVVVILVLPCYPVFYLFFKTNKINGVLYLRVHLCRAILWFSGIRVKTTYESEMEGKLNKPLIYVANHTSYLDILILIAILPRKTIFIGKSELLKIPVLNLFFTYLDIPVDRGEVSASATTFLKTFRKIKQAYGVVVFPEGGIFPNYPTLNHFKDGAFLLAKKSKTNILPVPILGAWKVLPDSKNRAFPSKIEVILHQEIQVRSNELVELKSMTMNIIQKSLDKYLANQ